MEEPIGWLDSKGLYKISEGKTNQILQWSPTATIVRSPGDRFFGIFTPGERHGSRYRPRSFRFTVYKNNGERKYLIDGKMIAEEMPPVFILSGVNGSAVKIETAGGLVTFYDAAGNKRKEKLLFPEEDFNVEKSAFAKFSDNGKYLFISAMRSNRDDIESQPTLFLFTQSGRLLWEKPLGEMFGGKIGISPNGFYLVAYGYSFDPYSEKIEKRSVLFNRYGEKLYDYPFDFRFAEFSEDNNRLILCNRYTIYLLHPQSGQLLKTIEIGRGKRIIRDVKINDRKDFLVITGISTLRGGEYIFTAPQIHLFNKDGVELWSLKYPDEEFFSDPLLYLGKDSRMLSFSLHNRYIQYKVP